MDVGHPSTSTVSSDTQHNIRWQRTSEVCESIDHGFWDHLVARSTRLLCSSQMSSCLLCCIHHGCGVAVLSSAVQATMKVLHWKMQDWHPEGSHELRMINKGVTHNETVAITIKESLCVFLGFCCSPVRVLWHNHTGRWRIQSKKQKSLDIKYSVRDLNYENNYCYRPVKLRCGL